MKYLCFFPFIISIVLEKVLRKIIMNKTTNDKLNGYKVRCNYTERAAVLRNSEGFSMHVSTSLHIVRHYSTCKTALRILDSGCSRTD